MVRIINSSAIVIFRLKGHYRVMMHILKERREIDAEQSGSGHFKWRRCKMYKREASSPRVGQIGPYPALPPGLQAGGHPLERNPVFPFVLMAPTSGSRSF